MKKVYLLRNGEGRYKVGVTGQNVQARAKQLQTGSDSKIEVISECEVFNGYKVESTLHKMYGSYRKEGEWFDLPIDKVANFDKDAKTIDDNLELLKKMGNPFI